MKVYEITYGLRTYMAARSNTFRFFRLKKCLRNLWRAIAKDRIEGRRITL